MAGYNPDYLRRLRTAVDEFGTAFESWAKTQDESDILKACLIIDLVAGRGELTDAAWERIEPLLPQVD
ncbi:hypothetical protein, partial [Kitasatospora sp. NPDC057541]|uniref:hypothetical protein n=1 Tax=Kitasatospora sp. NPDC057541 TaxID=3346161 RepID=UPI0036BE0FD9